MKLKDDKTCQKVYVPGHMPDGAVPVHTACRFGWCVILRCPVDMLKLGTEWGPTACPHKKNKNGTLRWLRFPEMQGKHHVAIKENTMRRKRSRSHKW